MLFKFEDDSLKTNKKKELLFTLTSVVRQRTHKKRTYAEVKVKEHLAGKKMFFYGRGNQKEFD